jgi:hypothetical protein
MHRSRIGIVLVDHPEESYEACLAFWAGVQGVRPTPDGPYAGVGEVGGLSLEVQRTGRGTPPRIHLDIESDDVAAEVIRLQGLGGTVMEERDGYVIMQDPGGLLFCVVGVQTGDQFVEDARTWE